MSCKISKSTLRLFGFCVFYLLYLFIGAAIFSAIEYSNEKQIIEDLKAKRQEFFTKHKMCLNDTDLEAFISNIIQAKNRGISLITNLTVEPNWSFGQAVFFSGTVLTTIGYGHVSPLSTGGKIFCIIYAIFGIPMTLIMISACVERLLLITNWLYDSMKRMRCFVNSFNMINLQLLTYTHLAIVFAFILTVFFLIPAAIFSSIEPDWDYLDGLYYCFISLSTIGLGDYIPGDRHAQPFRVVYKIATTFYLIVGVMFVMLLLSVITQVPELNLAKLFSLEGEASDPERQLLAEGSANSPSYCRQVDDDDVAPLGTPTQTNSFEASLNADQRPKF